MEYGSQSSGWSPNAAVKAEDVGVLSHILVGHVTNVVFPASHGFKVLSGLLVFIGVLFFKLYFGQRTRFIGKNKSFRVSDKFISVFISNFNFW